MASNRRPTLSTLSPGSLEAGLLCARMTSCPVLAAGSAADSPSCRIRVFSPRIPFTFRARRYRRWTGLAKPRIGRSKAICVMPRPSTSARAPARSAGCLSAETGSGPLESAPANANVVQVQSASRRCDRVLGLEHIQSTLASSSPRASNACPERLSK